MLAYARAYARAYAWACASLHASLLSPKGPVFQPLFLNGQDDAKAFLFFRCKGLKRFERIGNLAPNNYESFALPLSYPAEIPILIGFARPSILFALLC